MPRRCKKIEKPDYGALIPGSPQDIPEGYQPQDYWKPSVTVDVVLFTELSETPHVLLIQRKNRPFQGFWALPGGFIEKDETLEDSARRELKEEAGIRLEEGVLRQFKTFGDPGRDPRDRIITVVFRAMIDASQAHVEAGDDAQDVYWVPVEEALRSGALAADHGEIIRQAFQTGVIKI